MNAHQLVAVFRLIFDVLFILPQVRSIVSQDLALRPSQGLFTVDAVSLLTIDVFFPFAFYLVCIVKAD